MVLAGGTKFFSIGLNLPELIGLNRKEMAEFWERFTQTVFGLYTLPMPTVCAVCGHAVAGGNILALTCDYRIGSTENRKIGLNEILLGLPVPYLADLMLRQVSGDRAATERLYRAIT